MKNFITYKNCTNTGIFLAICLGVLFPAPPSLKKTIPLLLAIMLFFSFLKLDIKPRKFFRKELLLYPLIALLIYPLLLYLVTLPLAIEYRMGFMLLAIAPTAIGAPVVVDLIKGDHELIISQVLLSNLLAPLSCSLIFFLYFNGEELSVPVMFILQKIALLIFLPLAAALVVRRNDRCSRACRSFASYSNPLLFILIIGIATASASAQLHHTEPLLLVKLVLLTGSLAVALFAAGFLLAPTSHLKKTAAVMLGHKNTALSIWIGLSNFDALVILPIVIYIIFHHSINAILVHKYYQKT